MSSDEPLRDDASRQSDTMTSDAEPAQELKDERQTSGSENEASDGQTPPESAEAQSGSAETGAEAPASERTASAGTEAPEDNSSAGSGDGEASARSAEAPAESRRPRVRLNPSVRAGDDKPVPTYGSAESPSAPETPQSQAVEERESDSTTAARESASATSATQTETPAQATPEAQTPASPSTEEATETASASQSETAAEAPPETRPPGSVELPPKVEELDANLEAEIDAALSGENVAAQQAAPVAGSETEQAETPVPSPTDEDSLESGTRLKGTVDSVHGDNVFVDLGLRSPGLLSLRQFGSKSPEKGQQVECLVDRVSEEEGLIHLNLPRASRKVGSDWDAVSVGQTVDCVVTKTNKGGLEVTVGSLRGFMPASQVDLRYVPDLEAYVGQKLQAQVTEANRKKRNLIVSRRACLEAERKEAEELLWAKLDVGQQYAGTVKTIKDYGAFIDIGGVDGFLHIGEMSWTRLNHPSQILKEGDEVQVQVIAADREKKKISLGMRQLVPNPWEAATEKYAKGTTVSGKVTKTTKFGAFIELEPGLEGLVHISELDHRRVNKVTEVLNVGQEIDVQVLEVDPERQRISLSLKALQPKPEPEKKEADKAASDERDDPVRRKNPEDLKGGIGEGGGGKLFGDPRNFK